MPEWHKRDEWTPMGLWDVENQDGVLKRKIYAPMLERLRHAQKRVAKAMRAGAN